MVQFFLHLYASVYHQFAFLLTHLCSVLFVLGFNCYQLITGSLVWLNVHPVYFFTWVIYLFLIFLIHNLKAVYDVQVKEMGETNRPSDLTRSGSEQLADRKKGFTDWMKIMRPQNEEKDHWVEFWPLYWFQWLLFSFKLLILILICARFLFFILCWANYWKLFL